MRSLPLLLLLTAFAANGDDVQEPAGFWAGQINSPVPATIAGGKVIHAEQLGQLLKREKPLVVDVSNEPKRPPGMAPDAPWLPLPQEIIPGSVWLPGVGMADIDPETDESFRKHLSQATGRDPDHPVVVYCHERCWLSWNAAKRAIGYGYRRVYWFPEGMEGWRAAGNTTVVGKAWPAATEHAD
ncbi:MAG TPA: rhodanese-like domain-containing protein [Povalibacter sp.]